MKKAPSNLALVPLRDTNRHHVRRVAVALAAGAALALAACDSGGAETGPGGVSEGEARALDEAASQLDHQRLPDDALPEIEAPQPDNEATGTDSD